MAKNILVSNGKNRTVNTIAGISLILTLGLLQLITKPVDIYAYVINIVIALIVGGIVYFITNLIYKKRSKEF